MKSIDNKKTSFMANVLIVLIAQFAVKVLGMVYRMVITNIEGFGDSGNGFYTAGFNARIHNCKSFLCTYHSCKDKQRVFKGQVKA